MSALVQELRLALRVVVKSPWQTAAFALVLGVGIGLNVSMFTLFDQLVLRPPAGRDLDRLAIVMRADPKEPGRSQPVMASDFLELKARARCFERLASYEDRDVRLGTPEDPVSVRAGLVSSDYFATLGVAPALGRAFAPGEEEAAAAGDQLPPVVLSHELWRKHFAGDAHVVGKTLRLDGRDHAVIGVMPPAFGVPRGAELWQSRALALRAAQGPEAPMLIPIGRLRPGVSLAQAGAEMTALLRHSDSAQGRSVLSSAIVIPARRFAVEDGVQILATLLLGTAGFVLLAACANVGNLQIARGLGRQAEYGLRLAVGASRWRVIRLVLAESLLQALLAGVVGAGLSVLALAAIRSGMPAEVSAQIVGWSSLAVDHRSLAWALALAVCSAVLAAVLPALWLSKTDLSAWLRAGLGTSSLGRRRHRARNVLVAAQVALTLVLLAGAAMMVDGFVRRSTVSEGLMPETLLTVQLNLKSLDLNEAQAREVTEAVRERLAALPQVRSVALVANIPFRRHPRARFEPLRLDGTAAGSTDTAPYAMVQAVSEPYFRTMNLRLLAGRELDAGDGAASTPVTVVSQTTARLLAMPGAGIGSAVGRTIRLGGPGSSDPPLLVVGVVGDMRHFAIGQDAPYTCYRPDTQVSRPATNLVVRTTTDAESMTAAIERGIRGLRSGQIGYSVRTMDRVITESTVGLAYMAGLLSLFAGISAVFSTVGLYALMAGLVRERTREIGVRMALGASGREVMRVITRDGARITLAGVALGLVGALALSAVLSSFIFGAGQANLFVVGALGLLQTGVAIAACHLPARRAAQVDPMVALRCE